MALTKPTRQTVQLTATGQSSAINVADGYRQTAYLRHVNGSGTITGQATANVQVRPVGSSLWFSIGPFGFGTTASAAVAPAPIALPDDVGEVRLDYTAPAGSTGHTCDLEIGRITEI